MLSLSVFSHMEEKLCGGLICHLDSQMSQNLKQELNVVIFNKTMMLFLDLPILGIMREKRDDVSRSYFVIFLLCCEQLK